MWSGDIPIPFQYFFFIEGLHARTLARFSEYTTTSLLRLFSGVYVQMCSWNLWRHWIQFYPICILILGLDFLSSGLRNSKDSSFSWGLAYLHAHYYIPSFYSFFSANRCYLLILRLFYYIFALHVICVWVWMAMGLWLQFHSQELSILTWWFSLYKLLLHLLWLWLWIWFWILFHFPIYIKDTKTTTTTIATIKYTIHAQAVIQNTPLLLLLLSLLFFLSGVFLRAVRSLCLSMQTSEERTIQKSLQLLISR